jgi:hypothetical protein
VPQGNASPWVESLLNPPAQAGGFFYASVFSKFLEIFWGGLFCQRFDKVLQVFLK